MPFLAKKCNFPHFALMIYLSDRFTLKRFHDKIQVRLFEEGASAEAKNMGEITTKNRTKPSLDEMLKVSKLETSQKDHELKELKLELKRLQDELVEAGKFSIIGQIAAEAAHEINNPLAAIRIYIAEMIKDVQNDNINPAETVSSLTIIDQNIERITRAVHNLRQISRKSNEEFSEQDLNAIIQESIFILRKPLEKEDILIVENYASGPLHFFSSTDKINQLMSNLIINARDAILATKRNDGKIIVQTGINKKDQSVWLSVKDNGIGIESSILEQIFTPFFTTKDEGKGVGLGLAIVKRILDEHKASVSIESKSGDGACFTLTFPRDRRAAPR